VTDSFISDDSDSDEASVDSEEPSDDDEEASDDSEEPSDDYEETSDDDEDGGPRRSMGKKHRRASKQKNELHEPEPKPEHGSIEYLRRKSEKAKMKMLQALGMDAVVAQLSKPKAAKKVPPNRKPQ
jgi:hypothetical protein